MGSPAGRSIMWLLAVVLVVVLVIILDDGFNTEGAYPLPMDDDYAEAVGVGGRPMMAARAKRGWAPPAPRLASRAMPMGVMESEGMGMEMEMDMQESRTSDDMSHADDNIGSSSGSASQEGAVGRMLVKNADVNFKLGSRGDVEFSAVSAAVVDTITQLWTKGGSQKTATAAGERGYVSSSYAGSNSKIVYDYDAKHRYRGIDKPIKTLRLEARVPSYALEDCLLQLKKIVLDPESVGLDPSWKGRVLHEQISAEDVTESFVDAEARAKALKASEDQVYIYTYVYCVECASPHSSSYELCIVYFAVIHSFRPL
jgi:hypothetical protein